jgi:hypothetical protein
MPRGVYDRSKTKTQREAEKQAAPKKTGRKIGRKSKTTQPVLYANSGVTSSGAPAEKLASLQSYFQTLVQAQSTGNFGFSLSEPIGKTLRRMEQLADQIEPVREIEAQTDTAGDTEEQEEVAQAPVPAPVPFNTAAPATHS